MNCYLIYDSRYKGIETRMAQLERACGRLGIAYQPLDGLTVDHTQLPVPGRGDMLYNVSRGNEALESLLLTEAVTSFYLHPPGFVTHNSNTVKYATAHQKAGLSQPRTIFEMTTNRALLRRYVEHLGGFPVVLKVMGGTLGIGTMQVDSMAALVSLTEYLLSAGTQFVMRQFINARRGSRLYVLGDEVILAGDFAMQADDFRNPSALQDLEYTVTHYPNEMKLLAIDAARVANVAFAGVDILEGEDGRFYLLEVNFPAGFALAQYLDFDLGGHLIAYLYHRALKAGNI